MMNRSTFKETIKSLVEARLGDSYIVELQTVTKVNVTLTALVVRKASSTIGVTIYLDSLYEEYRSTGEDVNLMAHFNFSLSELIAVAKENTPKLFPATFRSMSEVLADLMPIFSAPDEPNDFMWVLSNTKNINGAGAIIFSQSSFPSLVQTSFPSPSIYLRTKSNP